LIVETSCPTVSFWNETADRPLRNGSRGLRLI
jgi:hypothetical protein